MTHDDVTISVITHSALAESKRCLSAVLASRGGAKLILTANGNPDVAEYFGNLALRNGNIEVVINMDNLGFIEPNNHAFSVCDTPYFVCLNDDTIPPPEWLSKLKDMPPVAVISGPNAYQLDANFVGGKRGLPYDYIEGSCIMVKTEAIRPHGLFSHYLKIAYCEDADLCLRMRSLGHAIHKSDFSLFHHAGTTSRAVRHLHSTMIKNFDVCKDKWSRYLKTRAFE